jgi:hypothetical protein
MGRTFDLLSNRKVYQKYNVLKILGKENPFFSMFSYVDKGVTINDTFTSRYNPKVKYTTELSIFNYKHRNAENVHTNVAQSDFNVKGIAHARIAQPTFYNALNTFANVYPKKYTPYDVRLGSSSDDTFLYVAIEGNRYIEEDGVLIDSYTDKPAAKKVSIFTETKMNGDVVRIDNFGKRMYILPKNYSIFKTNNGVEIILIKNSLTPKDEIINGLENFKGFLHNLRNINIIDFQDMSNAQNNLTSEQDLLLDLMEATIKATHDSHLRRFLKIKRSNYIKFKSTVNENEA